MLKNLCILRYYIVLILLVSCSDYKKTEFEKSIEKEYNTLCKESKDCEINIREITSFKWDKMFVFKSSASLETINEALGFEYPYYFDIAERVIFLKKNNIVYHDDYYSSFNDEIYTIIKFKLPNELLFETFDKNNAIFKIEKKIIKDVQIYYLLSHK